MERLAREAPRLRCELVAGEPEETLPALAFGDVDLVLGDEWRHNPEAAPRACAAMTCSTIRSTSSCRAAIRSCAAPGHGAARRARRSAWTTGPAGMGWDEMTRRTCRELGGFEPDVRHRTNDPTVCVASLPAGSALRCCPTWRCANTVAGVALRTIAEGPVGRSIFAATRAPDAAARRPSALLAAVRDAADAVSG